MESLDRTFAALADPTRRAILARLAQGEAHVGALVEPFPISGPAISRHLRVLEHAGLIEREANAQWRICRLRPAGLRAAHDWLDQYRTFWEESLDRLAELLEKPPATNARSGRRPGPHTPRIHRRTPPASARKSAHGRSAGKRATGAAPTRLRKARP
jgi:DNA-binding transcriptional ArsR family regulator